MAEEKRLVRILYIGESWLGSTARALREALAQKPGVEIDDISPNHFFPSSTARAARAVSRLLAPMYRRELQRHVLEQARKFQPDRVIIYKCPQFDPDFLSRLKASGLKLINVFPDFSPHIHGRRLTEGLGVYDLVISTKPFHPPLWYSTYGYTNRCICVPHGYATNLHLRSEPPQHFAYDVVIAASGRPQYHKLMATVARHLPDPALRVALVGPGWDVLRNVVPQHWVFLGPRHGVPYVDIVRNAKIVIAPVQTETAANGRPRPGDVDSTRTYELAAAHCFFIHRRTDFVRTVYDEATEVPLFDDAPELVEKIVYYLEHEAERTAMAAAAHRRAVPAYSRDARAAAILDHLRAL